MSSSLLYQLLSQPTTSFCEQQVASCVVQFLARKGVPYFLDHYGNMVVGVEDVQAYRRLLKKRSKESLRLFVAHMDHPGFRGVEWEGSHYLRAQWYGGGGPDRGIRHAPVWLSGRGFSGELGRGKIIRYQNKKTPRGTSLTEVTVALEQGPFMHKGKQKIMQSWREWVPTDLFGGFSFGKSYWRRGNFLYAKALDDLVGVYVALETISRTWKSKNVLGLLTRAEEIGLLGACAHFQQMPDQDQGREVIVVSLETSRALPGAEFGKGPVIRLGDYSHSFDPRGVEAAWSVANHLKPKLNFQKRLMDGGTCEASAALVFGWPAVGLSVPLGNYHNKGGNNVGLREKLSCQGKPAPEFIHWGDLKGLLRLSKALVERPFSFRGVWKAKRQVWLEALEKKQEQWNPLT